MNYYEAQTLRGHETNVGEFDLCVFTGEMPACAFYLQYNAQKDYVYKGSLER